MLLANWEAAAQMLRRRLAYALVAITTETCLQASWTRDRCCSRLLVSLSTQEQTRQWSQLREWGTERMKYKHTYATSLQTKGDKECEGSRCEAVTGVWCWGGGGDNDESMREPTSKYWTASEAARCRHPNRCVVLYMCIWLMQQLWINSNTTAQGPGRRGAVETTNCTSSRQCVSQPMLYIAA